METNFQTRHRELVKQVLMNSGCGHTGGSISMSEILASLFEDVMKHNCNNPDDPNRDRFVLSKGHAGLGLYVALHMAGYISKEVLFTFGIKDGQLMNHPESKTVGVEVSTGSLGHGLPVSCGMALAGQKTDKDFFTFCLMGDAEIQEGSVWEAAMFAAHNKLNRLVAIVDNNGVGNDGPIDDIVTLGDIEGKWESFGFKTRIVDGHNRAEITKALESFKQEADGPYALIANTVKGKGLIESIAGTGSAHYLKGTPEEIESKFIN